MSERTERNRLRNAGRIPQETLDYLASKRRWDSRVRWWELPIYLVVTLSIVLLVMLLLRSLSPLVSRESLFLIVLIFTLLSTLRSGIQR